MREVLNTFLSKFSNPLTMAATLCPSGAASKTRIIGAEKNLDISAVVHVTLFHRWSKRPPHPSTIAISHSSEYLWTQDNRQSLGTVQGSKFTVIRPVASSKSAFSLKSTINKFYILNLNLNKIEPGPNLKA